MLHVDYSVSHFKQGITFERARQLTNRSPKMTIWSLGSYLCYEGNLSAGGGGHHYNTIRHGAQFYHYLSGGRNHEIDLNASNLLFISTEHN